MTQIYSTIIILALIALIAWREQMHARQLKAIMFLKKSSNPDEYAHYRSIDEPEEEEPQQEVEIGLDSLTQEDVKNLV